MKIEAQKELLKELASAQGVLVSSASARGKAFPQAVVKSHMRPIFEEFRSGKIARAPTLLSQCVARLGTLSLRPPWDAKILRWFASAEQEILDRFKKGAEAPRERLDNAKAAAAAVRQRQVREKTGRLQGEIERLGAEVGTLKPGTLESVRQARGEQGLAAEALGQSDSREALAREQKALDHLEKGRQKMEQSLQSQKSISSGAGKPFGKSGGAHRPGRPGGRSGANTNYVELPRSNDYHPPKELREEIERSVEEKRPESFDGVIKEYFKRISQ